MPGGGSKLIRSTRTSQIKSNFIYLLIFSLSALHVESIFVLKNSNLKVNTVVAA